MSCVHLAGGCNSSIFLVSFNTEGIAPVLFAFKYVNKSFGEWANQFVHPYIKVNFFLPFIKWSATTYEGAGYVFRCALRWSMACEYLFFSNVSIKTCSKSCLQYHNLISLFMDCLSTFRLATTEGAFCSYVIIQLYHRHRVVLGVVCIFIFGHQ
jgi:hypothetical protein